MSKTESTSRTDESVPDRMAERTLRMAVLCLLIVVMVLTFGMVYATLIAGNAQDSAQRQEEQNAALREELECRSRGATDFDLSMANLQASIAQALLALEADDGEFKDALLVVETNTEKLEEAAVVRQQTLAACSVTP